MKKYIYSLCTILMMVLVGCKKESVRIEIPQLEDQMHLSAPAETVFLNARDKDAVAVTFRWTWPELQYDATSYDYAFKMDVADNQFATSIPKMALAGDNSLSFTHKELNDWLEGWGAKAGQMMTLEAELIATPRGTKEYVKPMVSITRLTVVGYASTLYLLGSATQAGEDYERALLMDKEPGTDCYNWIGTLVAGDVRFVSDRSATAESYGTFAIPREGCYHLRYDLAVNKLSWVEPLYMVGSATEGGWSLADATALNTDRYPILSWTGFLGAGELKFACHPQSGLFEDAFYKAAEADANPEGEQTIVYDADGSGEDNKWLITEAGIYSVEVNMSTLTVVFKRDHSMDDLPVKEVWICGNATPSGWDTPFPEKMAYDFNAVKGTFVWTGELKVGELKFPCNNSSYEGAFYLADNFNEQVSLTGSHHINYFASTEGVDDKKWIIDEPGYYKIELNVMDNIVKFRKQ